MPSSYPYPCDDPLIGQELPIRICSDVPGSKRRQCGVQMLVPVACSGGDGAPRGYFVAQKGERYIVPAGQVRRALVDQSAVLEQLAEDGRCDVAARLMRSGTEPPSAAFDACPPLDDIAPERVIPDFDPGEIEATARNDAPTKARTVYIPALRAHGTIERWVTDNVAEIRYGQPGGGFTSRMFARREFEAV